MHTLTHLGTLPEQDRARIVQVRLRWFLGNQKTQIGQLHNPSTKYALVEVRRNLRDADLGMGLSQAAVCPRADRWMCRLCLLLAGEDWGKERSPLHLRAANNLLAACT